MIRVAYFLARYSLASSDGGPRRPPAEMQVSSLEEVYRRLFPNLHGGRDFALFRSSLVGSINGIRGKLQPGRRLQRKEARSVADLLKLPRALQWEQLRQFFGDMPADSPRIVKLKKLFQTIHPLPVPPAPKELKRLRRIMTAYERPSEITRYVKSTRGDRCQLCNRKFFMMRNGRRYCEVHHLYQLSKNPPVECLAPEYLIAVCATCHRMLHYADADEPERADGAWQVRIGKVIKRFSTRPVINQ
jgi:hypothetical protein